MGKLRIPFVKGPVMAQKTVMFIGKSWENGDLTIKHTTVVAQKTVVSME